MPSEDVYKYDFVVFDKDTAQISVTYSEAALSTWRQHIELQVVEEGRGSVVQSVRLSANEVGKYFRFENLGRKKYTLKLAFKFPGSKFELLANELAADLTGGKTLHAGDLHFEVRESEAQEVSRKCVASQYNVVQHSA